MEKIAVIICWFGPYPNYFDLWKRSAAFNSTVDFLFFGDHDLGPDAPGNFQFHRTTLQELECRIRRTLKDDRINCRESYKLCDFRPMYGEIFAEELSGYDFWGHCDIDLIFGDIRRFLTAEKLRSYDKIYPCGHLSVYRNSSEVNGRWRLPFGKFELDDVLTSALSFDFDEWNGIYNIYMRKQFPFFRDAEYFNPLGFTRRFRFLERSAVRYGKAPRDYDHQCFYWEEGRLLRAFIDDDGEIRCDEGAYIHLEKRRFPGPTAELLQCPSFFCTPSGFVVKPYGGIARREDILRMNPFRGRLLEKLEWLWLKKKKRFLARMHLSKHRFAPRSMQIRHASWTNTLR